jgi:hypothetical protein
MEHGCRIEKFRVKTQTPTLPGQGAPK